MSANVDAANERDVSCQDRLLVWERVELPTEKYQRAAGSRQPAALSLSRLGSF